MFEGESIRPDEVHGHAAPAAVSHRRVQPGRSRAAGARSSNATAGGEPGAAAAERVVQQQCGEAEGADAAAGVGSEIAAETTDADAAANTTAMEVEGAAADGGLAQWGSSPLGGGGGNNTNTSQELQTPIATPDLGAAAAQQQHAAAGGCGVAAESLDVTPELWFGARKQSAAAGEAAEVGEAQPLAATAVATPAGEPVVPALALPAATSERPTDPRRAASAQGARAVVAAAAAGELASPLPKRASSWKEHAGAGAGGGGTSAASPRILRAASANARAAEAADAALPERISSMRIRAVATAAATVTPRNSRQQQQALAPTPESRVLQHQASPRLFAPAVQGSQQQQAQLRVASPGNGDKQQVAHLKKVMALAAALFAKG